MSPLPEHHDLPIAVDVSRETLDRLDAYMHLLVKWSDRINLVASSTLDDAWTRHIADSAQVLNSISGDIETWVDLGSGAGFPGMVVAALRPELRVTLIESDQRKAAFLRAVIRETGIGAEVLNERIEHAPPQNADVVSARALAPLIRLLRYASRHLNPQGAAIFLKGHQVQPEVEAALESWRFHCDTSPSRTQPGAVLLKLTEIERV